MLCVSVGLMVSSIVVCVMLFIDMMLMCVIGCVVKWCVVCVSWNI